MGAGLDPGWTVHGERVRCRVFQEADAVDLLEAWDESRPRLSRWLGGAEVIDDLADAEAAVCRRRSAWVDGSDLVAAVVEHASERFLGEASLTPDWESLTFELGFWLRPSAEGYGYMTQATQMLRDWAFRDLAARRLIMTCDAANVRSIAVARRTGLRQVAARRLQTRTLLTFERTRRGG